MTSAVCPCDGATLTPPVNLPGLSHISYRVGTYADFRRALLTPLVAPPNVEQTLSIRGLPVWRTSGAGDLGVMIAEWFAYIADVLTFYNERIANQDYLRTADLPESVAPLIAILGYRPRPAIGAQGLLAALVTAGQSASLPAGLQFQSKPAPGQSPQTFELHPAVTIGPPDQIPAIPPPFLLASVAPQSSWTALLGGMLTAQTQWSHELTTAARTEIEAAYKANYGSKSPYVVQAHFDKMSTGGSSTPVVQEGGGIIVIDITDTVPTMVPPDGADYSLFLRGAVDGIDPGAMLVLAPRNPSTGDPMLALVTGATIAPLPAGGQQTMLTITLYGTPPAAPFAAAQARLEQPNQTATIWSLYTGGLYPFGSSYYVHLASLVRQIRPNDWVLFTPPPPPPQSTQAPLTPLLMQVSGVSEAIWDAVSPPAIPPKVPIPHTVLAFASALPDGWDNTATVRFGWVSAGTLLDQPVSTWSATPPTLVASGPQAFPSGPGSYPILLQDATGIGVTATASSSDGATLTLSDLPSPLPSPLRPPFKVLPNVLNVSRGKTVANEVLGSGDATNPAQSFKLSQSPVTYLQQNATYASTISLTVGGQPWTEVASFYGQPAGAAVFVTSEDDAGFTHVTFGDGVNGARLPTGVNNVVATYRIGAGYASPGAGKLTVIAQSYPGLRAILNPIAVGGGADADPPALVKSYAPRSVLAFGRAVSVFDYEAIAALTPSVTRAKAVWAWNDAAQRTMVTVYVGDDGGALTAATNALAQAGDPNRPVQVLQATPVTATLSLSLVTVDGMDTDAISANVVTALTDPQTGLFGTTVLAIGQPVFDSQIEAAVLAVPGAVAITAATFFANGAVDAGPLHNPGEGAYYVLDFDPTDITIVTGPGSNGG